MDELYICDHAEGCNDEECVHSKPHKFIPWVGFLDESTTCEKPGCENVVYGIECIEYEEPEHLEDDGK